MTVDELQAVHHQLHGGDEQTYRLKCNQAYTSDNETSVKVYDSSPSREYKCEKKDRCKDEIGNFDNTIRGGRNHGTKQQETEKFKIDINKRNVEHSNENEAEEETKRFHRYMSIRRYGSESEKEATTELSQVKESECETHCKVFLMTVTMSTSPDTCLSITDQFAASNNNPDSVAPIPSYTNQQCKDINDVTVTRSLSKHDKTAMNTVAYQNSAPLSGERRIEKINFDNLNKKYAGTCELLTNGVEEIDTNIHDDKISNVIESLGKQENNDKRAFQESSLYVERMNQNNKMPSMTTGEELIWDSNKVWEENKITGEEVMNLSADADELNYEKGDLEMMEKNRKPTARRKKTKQYNSTKKNNADCTYVVKKHDVKRSRRKHRQSAKRRTSWRRSNLPLYKKLQLSKKYPHFQPDNISPVGSSPAGSAKQSYFGGPWKCRGHSQGGNESSGNPGGSGERSDSTNGGRSHDSRRGRSVNEGSENNDRNQFNSPEKNFKKHRAKESAEATPVQVVGTIQNGCCPTICLLSGLNPQNRTQKCDCSICNDTLIPMLKHFAKCHHIYLECSLCKNVVRLLTSHLCRCEVVRLTDTDGQSGLSCPLKICKFVADERLNLDSEASLSDQVIEILSSNRNLNKIKEYLCLFYEIRVDTIGEKVNKFSRDTATTTACCSLDCHSNESLDSLKKIPTDRVSNYPRFHCSESPEHELWRTNEQRLIRSPIYGLGRPIDHDLDQLAEQGLSQCLEQDSGRPSRQGLERSTEQSLRRPWKQGLVHPSLQGLDQPSEQGIDRPSEQGIDRPSEQGLGQHNLRRLEDFCLDSSSPETVHPVRSLPLQPNRSFTEWEELPKLRSLGQGLVQYGTSSQLLQCVTRWEKDSRDGQLQVDRESTDGVILKQFQFLHIMKGFYKEDSQWFTAVALGTGAFGACFLASDAKTERQFCVKKVSLRKFKGDEVRTWKRLNNPYILQLYGAVRSNSTIYMFSEFINGISLSEHIQNERRLNAWEALVYLKQLLDVLIYLKQKHILHEDLKAENVMLQGCQFHVVVVDFGVSRILEPPEYSVSSTDIVGTQSQFSPEKARGESHSYGADLWAVICLFVHMLSGSPPWIKRFFHARSLVFLIGTKSPPKEDIPRELPKELNNLIISGWQVNPLKRPAAEDLLKHRSFQLLDKLAPSDPWFRRHLSAPSLETVSETLSDHVTEDSGMLHLEDDDLPNLPEFQSDLSALQIEVVSPSGKLICSISLNQSDVEQHTWSYIVAGICGEIFSCQNLENLHLSQYQQTELRSLEVYAHDQQTTRFSVEHDDLDQKPVDLDGTLLDAQKKRGHTIQVIASPLVKHFNRNNWCIMRDGIQYDTSYNGIIQFHN